MSNGRSNVQSVMKTILFWAEGPMIKYSARHGIIEISDLNPDQQMRWMMPRVDAIKLAWKLFWAAVLS